LLEEWLFRGLLQGWLRRASPLGHIAIVLLTSMAGVFKSIPKSPDDPILWTALAFTLIVVAVYTAGVLWIWWPVFQAGLHHFVEMPAEAGEPTPGPVEGQTPVLLPQGPRWEAFKRANARWVIFGSAMLFALLHERWPDPIALLPFGLVLGWLAYRKKKMVPGILLHSLFNAVAFGALWFSAGE